MATSEASTILVRATAHVHAEATLQEAGPSYLESQRPFIAEQTYRRQRHHLRQIISFFGSYTLKQCADPDLIRAYQVQRLKRAQGDCINKELSLLKGILVRGRLWDQVSDDFRWLPVRRSTVGRALSDEMYERLFAAAQTEPTWYIAYLVAKLATNSILNPSEIFALRLSEVDLDRAMIYVRFEGKLHIAGKTRFRPRDVPLNQYALEAARLLLERAAKLGATEPLHYLIPYRVQSGLYDLTRPANGCRTAWRKLTRSIGARGLRIKDLRHHGITVLDEHGVAKETMRSLAGHSPNSQLIDHYSHPRVEARRKAAAILEANHRSLTEKKPVGSVTTVAAPLTGTWAFLVPMER